MSAVEIIENPEELESARKRIFEDLAVLGNWRAVAQKVGEPVGSVYNFAVGSWVPRNNRLREKYGLSPVVFASGDADVLIVCPDCGRSFVKDHPNRTHCKICRPPRIYKRRRVSVRHFDALAAAYAAHVLMTNEPSSENVAAFIKARQELDKFE